MASRQEVPYYISPFEEKLGLERYLKLKPEITPLYNELLEQINNLELFGTFIDEDKTVNREALNEYIQTMLADYEEEDRAVLAKVLFNAVIGFGPIDLLFEDPKLSDILVNSYDQIYVESQGVLKLSRLQFCSEGHLMTVVQRILARTNSRVDFFTPYVNTSLEDGSRVNIIIPPVSVGSPAISIRRFTHKLINLEQMVASYTLTQPMANLLDLAVKSRLNMIIIGGAGNGKTTLLNNLAHYILPTERILTIEDVPELNITHPHIVHLHSRIENTEGVGRITIRDLFINALRMRPTRIIIGEVRGLEILEMLQAMSTGHDGSLSTMHASSVEDVPYRILNMIAMAGIDIPSEAILMQISNTIDLIVEVRHSANGHRFIHRISECLNTLTGQFKVHDLYCSEGLFDPSNPAPMHYKRQEISAHFKERIEAAGYDSSILTSSDS